jgi:DnaJ-class molecular chaperone
MTRKQYAVCIALFAALFIGCTVQRQMPSIVEVKCSECDGRGKVTYGPDHPIVKMGFDEGTYDCPMCGGSGQLYEDATENRTTYDGRGKRPSTMPPKRSDGREFDGGPDFGNGSWAQLDEDGVWRRYGG